MSRLGQINWVQGAMHYWARLNTHLASEFITSLHIHELSRCLLERVLQCGDVTFTHGCLLAGAQKMIIVVKTAGIL